MTAQLFYEEQIAFYSKAIQSVKQKTGLFAMLRLVAFSLFAISFYFLIKEFTGGLLFLTLVVLAVFLSLVIYALKLRDTKLLLEKLHFVNANELGMLSNDTNAFDDGTVLMNDKGFAQDLDIFGSRSLFHLINRCTTAHGKEYLATLLQKPLLVPGEITRRQEAVQLLSKQTRERQYITANGLLHQEEEGNLHGIAEWLQSGRALHQLKWLQVARWIVPLYNIPCFLWYIASGEIRFLAVGVVAGWLITARFAKYIHQQHQLVGKKQTILQQYAGILKTFTAVETGSSPLLQSLYSTAHGAYRAIGKLARLSSFFDQRLNLLVNVFLNSLIVYDMQCIVALEQWKEKFKHHFSAWVETVGDIECLNSLAGFAFNHPHYCYPSVNEDEIPGISATRIAHPLIPEVECVANDFEAGNNDRLMLVTGSNMSGKTTFLRTLGINLILAQSGAPVCAASFRFTPLDILTSIRVNDSLQEHTSYFMAELKRLQQIILQLQTGKPALVLIDEILRGTNSEDKTHGSEAFIKQLLQYNCITLFATHDLTLATLENEYSGAISNYCFESIIQNNTLHFDYKLQKGVAKNKNASFLMKAMGIIKSE